MLPAWHQETPLGQEIQISAQLLSTCEQLASGLGFLAH